MSAVTEAAAFLRWLTQRTRGYAGCASLADKLEAEVGALTGRLDAIGKLPVHHNGALEYVLVDDLRPALNGPGFDTPGAYSPDGREVWTSKAAHDAAQLEPGKTKVLVPGTFYKFMEDGNPAVLIDGLGGTQSLGYFALGDLRVGFPAARVAHDDSRDIAQTRGVPRD